MLVVLGLRPEKFCVRVWGLGFGVGPSQPVVIVRNFLYRGPIFGLKRPFLAPKWGF
jgi:hypothetical protein